MGQAKPAPSVDVPIGIVKHTPLGGISSKVGALEPLEKIVKEHSLLDDSSRCECFVSRQKTNCHLQPD
jgi:hypothetical protein